MKPSQRLHGYFNTSIVIVQHIRPQGIFLGHPYFNTSHVFIQHGTSKDSDKWQEKFQYILCVTIHLFGDYQAGLLLLISIHLLLLFNKCNHINTLHNILFQYTHRYCSTSNTHVTDMHDKIFQYIYCYCSTFEEAGAEVPTT